jgi:hypothetical protein
MEKREWQPREMKLVQEYIIAYHPKARRITRVRLGQMSPQLIMPGMTPEERNQLTVWRRWADAIAIYPDHVVIVEGAIRSDPGDVSKLKLYARLFPVTPEFAEDAKKRLELELVSAIPDPVTAQMAGEDGIKYVTFSPPWVDEYIKILYPRERRAPLV